MAYNTTETIYLRNEDRNVILSIDKSEISKLNNIIINFLKVNYKKYGYIYGNAKMIEIGNILLNTEYLGKFVNNKTLFGIIAERNKLKTVEEFKSYIMNNLSRLYDIDGIEFIDNYELVRKTTEKGKRGELACKENFEKMLFKKYKKTYKVESPKNSTEDISGIDGKVKFNNISVTLQIKPFTRSITKGNKIVIYSRGSMCFNTHYLLLYRESKKFNKYYYDFITLKNGDNYDRITYNNGAYETDVQNIIKS